MHALQEHLQDVLPSILDGLADEAEGVRDAALAAGRTFVDLYAETALPLLLPAVEDGILNDNWRIRQSSVELLGQLLFKASVFLLISCLTCTCGIAPQATARLALQSSWRGIDACCSSVKSTPGSAPGSASSDFGKL